MNQALSLLTGVGIGAGLMYILDPQTGRRRRALVRDKMVGAAHKAQDVAETVGRDMRNRAQGLASGDISVLIGGKRALSNPLQGGWSPTGRALLVGLGTGLFLYGLTRHAPTACVVGTLGCALAAEGFTNAGIEDLTCAAGKIADKAREVTDMAGDAARSAAGRLGIGEAASEFQGAGHQ